MNEYTIQGFVTRERFIALLNMSRTTFYRWVNQTNIELPSGLLSVTDQQQIITAFEARPRKKRKINAVSNVQIQ
ncbi:MAG: hypothetical protein RLZZ628_592 [Bacteroidota bacterium]|jgi:hypothetical protein